MAQGTHVEILLAVSKALQSGQIPTYADATLKLLTSKISFVQSVSRYATKPEEKVYYFIERAWDGRVFASRIVRTTQGLAMSFPYRDRLFLQMKRSTDLGLPKLPYPRTRDRQPRDKPYFERRKL
ncbi:hypothetical protein M434DRAFT_30190 [Hypoxylon sp. CO27-5]|nr:hypothetical protein M434DRAFT_30190 [Hypoxylon sp. CO27-5]